MTEHSYPEFVKNPTHQRFVDKFFDPNETKKKYVMGMSIEGGGRRVRELVDIDGFLDDFTSISEFMGKPVFRSEEIDKNSLVLVCSSVRPVTAFRNLKNKGFSNVLDYPIFYMHAENESLEILILGDFAHEWEVNCTKFQWVRSLLKDDESRDVFDRVLEYRLTANLGVMEGFSFLPLEQCFPDFMEPNGEVFADVGGYQGETSLEFIKRCPNYKKVYLFEPSPSNFSVAKSRLSGFRDVNCIHKGVSNAPDTLRFDVEGSRSSFTQQGSTEVAVDSLDNLISEKITFLKMDVFEPAESRVIEGATKHILNDHPKLALVVYHKPNELWAIPRQVLSIREDYDLFLRHYTEGIYETVMYFRPRK